MFRNKAPATAVDLVSQFLRYDPKQRLDPFDGLAHPFFDELREPNARLPNGKPLPNLYNFTDSGNHVGLIVCVLDFVSVRFPVNSFAVVCRVSIDERARAGQEAVASRSLEEGDC